MAPVIRSGQQQATHLSLIVSTLNEGSELQETIKSVYSGTLVPAETIVIDDGGTDDSCAALQQRDWRARGVKVHHIERCGVAAARNTGSSLATGERQIFLDAHCRLDENCIAELDAALSARPHDIMAAALCDFGGCEHGCGARLIDAELRIRWLPTNMESLAPVPIAPGGCLAVSRARFNYLGGFGAFRELGQEDVDFSLRAWRAGVDIIPVSAAKLAHKFRPNPHYSLSSVSRAYNVARLALIHFEGSRREECLRRIIGKPRAAEALVDALASDWEDQKMKLSGISSRTSEAYFDNFGDWR